MVIVGRLAVVASALIACIVAPALRSFDQVYQFVQEYVGFISPGILAIFLLGFFWKRTNSKAALTAAILTIPLSTLFKFIPSLTHGRISDIPFLNRMSWVFAIIVAVMILITLADPKSRNNPQGLEIEGSMFKVSPSFIVASVIICGILAALYTVFW